MQVATQENISAVAGKNVDVSVVKRFTVAAGELVSMFAQKLGIRLFAGKGPVEIQAQSDAMSLLADKDITVASVNGVVRISAKKELTLACGGAFVKLADGNITLGGPLDLFIKTITIQKQGKQSMQPVFPVMPDGNIYEQDFNLVNHADGTPLAGAAYQITTASGGLFSGQASDAGVTRLAVTSPAEKLQVKATSAGVDDYHVHYCNAPGNPVCDGDNTINRID